MSRIARFFTVVVLLVGVGSGVLATELGVLVVGPKSDFTRIQDAMDSAADGDTIHVQSGVYVENLLIEKPIHLLGLGNVTLIPADIESPAICVMQEGSASIQHLAIGRASVGIQVSGECMVAYCEISSTEIGLKATVWEPGSVAALRCTFRGTGVGVELLGSGNVYVLESGFSEFGAAVLVGGRVTASVGKCMIESCYEGVVANHNATTVLLESEIRDCLGTAVRLSRSPYAEPVGELYVIESLIEGNGKWAISFGDINGDNCAAPFVPILGEGNVIRDNSYGVSCPLDIGLPEVFLAAPGS